MIKDLFKSIFIKPKIENEEAEKAMCALECIFLTDIGVPLEAGDHLEILRRYMHECAPKEDIKNALREITKRRDAYILEGKGVKAQTINEVLSVFEKHTDIIQELEDEIE